MPVFSNAILARMLAEPAPLPQNALAPKQSRLANALAKPLPMEGRFNILPLRQTDWPRMGNREWAIPGIAASMINALTAPGRAWKGQIPNSQIPQEALNFAGNLSLDSYAMSKALGRGAIPDADQPSTDIGMTVYHGTPHKFDTFDISKIGTGEGAQAYGHGLYFAEAKDTGNFYRKNTTGLQVSYKGVAIPDNDLRATYLALAKDEGLDAAIQGAQNNAAYNKNNPAMAQMYTTVRDFLRGVDPKDIQVGRGHLYHVDIPDETIGRMLDWDKPLGEQPHILEAFPGQEGLEGLTGKKLYENLQSLGYTQKGASELLRKKGIPGIRYLDAGSRGDGQGTRNFVLFDDKLAKIIKRE